jgi:polar amino acid transport system substrate-binding protein
MASLRFAIALIFALGLIAAGCGDDDESGNDDTAAAETVELSECTPETLETFKDGVLTVATDQPAYPPYFVDDDPTNGKGFESAVAYAIAEQLGFSEDQVEWTVVPFNASYAPGEKEFDFDVNQISITPKRAEQVDFSVPYYTANQAVVAGPDTDAAEATSLSDLADDEIGVQIGTTSLEGVEGEIQPSSDPQVYDNSNDVVTALKQGAVEAIVVDVPTALFLTATQVPDAVVVGQFSVPGGDEWGALLAKDSPLTPCVNAAIEELKSSGELAEIHDEWMSDAAKAPELPS